MTDLHRFVLYGKEATSLLHDMLNPLGALSIRLETLRNTKKEDQEVRQAQEILKRLERLVTGARRQLRRETIKETVSLHTEIENVFSAVADQAKALGVTLELKGEDQKIWTDSILIYKILQNLITNALDACVNQGEGIVTVETAKDRDAVHITVTDTGEGIKLVNQGRIFEPYFTTKHKTEGAGLGLSLVRELIEGQFHGALSLISSSQRGTTMHIMLPLQTIAEPTSD